MDLFTVFGFSFFASSHEGEHAERIFFSPALTLNTVALHNTFERPTVY